jgi:hypothetical protein
LEELTNILVGLEQRIDAHKHQLHGPEKKRRLLDENIVTIKKYLQVVTDDRDDCIVPVDVTDHSRETLLANGEQYAGKSVPEAAYQVLGGANGAMHAREFVQRLVEGGLHIKGKTPVTPVAASLTTDSALKKSIPTPSRRPTPFWAIRYDNHAIPTD